MIVIAMTDENRGDNPLTMIKRLPKNSILIFRHYADPNRMQLATDVVRACRKQNVRCLIAGDFRLAHRCRADGVHVPEYQLRRCPHRRFAPAHWIMTGAAHNEKSVRLIQQMGFDAGLLSPVFDTPSHPNARALGLVTFSAICHRSTVPVIALGGVRAARLLRLQKAGASGIAGIGLFGEK